MTNDAMTTTDADAVVKAAEVASTLISHDLKQVTRARELGREILYCEDMLRYRVFSALPECGIDPDRLTLEHPHPNLPGNKKVDTVILRGDDLARGNIVPETAIEFKYHHKHAKSSVVPAMNAGQLLKDFARLRDFAGVNRYVVYLTDDRMIRYFQNPSKDLTWLLDTLDGRVVSSACIPDKKTLRRYAGDWSRSARLRMMRKPWDVGNKHKLIVWQVWPA